MAVKLEFDRRPKWILTLNDSLLMIKRSSTHILRNMDQLLGTFFQPIMFLTLFTAVYSGSMELSLPPGINYLSFLLAGIIVQTLAFGSTTTALAVTNDLQKGIVDRFRSLPMSNLAVVNGHVVSDVLRNGLSTVVMIAVGLVLGFRTSASPLEWLMIAGMVVLFSLTFSWIAAIMGLLAKSVEGVQWMSFIIVFPLTFASSAFVQADKMHAYLRPFAENQPITHVVEVLRALLLNQPMGNHGWWAVGWCLAILAIAMPLAAWLFKRRTTQ